MQDEFATTVEAWNAFFSASAGISATLVGLLFVALALNPKIVGDTGPAGLRVWAGQTFHSFLMVLTISLIAIIPGESATAITIAMLIVGVTGLFGVSRAIALARRDPDPAWRTGREIVHFASPMIAYGICLWSAYLAWRLDPNALSWMVVIIFLLIMSATSDCWDLLKELGNPKPSATTE